ncbi:hypothetical protein AbraCBS73388_005597 [Aspergillus brasiliensis]|uniref:Uncharacterized protein n=1 Tax=Aspergillus brasiliensis TaxID=319629 RepID=A0A9W5Z1U5_9EURO|nr:hypothetical protein AbraCBS73388_005597 [Aspergillus brasiliensis]
MALLNKLNFITGNKNKLAEVKAILGTVIDVENQAVDLPEIQGTIEDIAREKCRRAAEVMPWAMKDLISCLTHLKPELRRQSAPLPFPADLDRIQFFSKVELK